MGPLALFEKSPVDWRVTANPGDIVGALQPRTMPGLMFLLSPLELFAREDLVGSIEHTRVCVRPRRLVPIPMTTVLNVELIRTETGTRLEGECSTNIVMRVFWGIFLAWAVVGGFVAAVATLATGAGPIRFLMVPGWLGMLGMVLLLSLAFSAFHRSNQNRLLQLVANSLGETVAVHSPEPEPVRGVWALPLCGLLFVGIVGQLAVGAAHVGYALEKDRERASAAQSQQQQAYQQRMQQRQQRLAAQGLTPLPSPNPNVTVQQGQAVVQVGGEEANLRERLGRRTWTPPRDLDDLRAKLHNALRGENVPVTELEIVVEDQTAQQSAFIVRVVYREPKGATTRFAQETQLATCMVLGYFMSESGLNVGTVELKSQLASGGQIGFRIPGAAVAELWDGTLEPQDFLRQVQ